MVNAINVGSLVIIFHFWYIWVSSLSGSSINSESFIRAFPVVVRRELSPFRLPSLNFDLFGNFHGHGFDSPRGVSLSPDFLYFSFWESQIQKASVCFYGFFPFFFGGSIC